MQYPQLGEYRRSFPLAACKFGSVKGIFYHLISSNGGYMRSFPLSACKFLSVKEAVYQENQISLGNTPTNPQQDEFWAGQILYRTKS
jgi:hypothetical protein